MLIRLLPFRTQSINASKPFRFLSKHHSYFQWQRCATIPKALLLVLSIFGGTTQAQITDAGPTSYSYKEQGNKVELVASTKFLASVVDTTIYSDQVSRQILNRLNNRINQQAEAAGLSYIKEINDTKKQVFIWERSINAKNAGNLFSKIYLRINVKDNIIPANSDYLLPTGGILVETDQDESSNLMTWVREQGKIVQKITNDDTYWVETDLGEDVVATASEISQIDGVRTAKPNFKILNLQ